METGNVVRFSSHPRPFLVKDSYCTDPDCTCNEVVFTFTEIADADEQQPAALSFSASVDLETWQEKDPPDRSPEVAAWVREFLADCPSRRRAEFKASYKEGKRVAKRMAEYTIDPVDVVEGKLVSFVDILTERRALSEGGSGYTYRFDHQGQEYLVEDLYCPNPDCDCETIHLEFFESVSQQDGENPRATIFHRFQAKVTFEGRLEVLERDKCSLAEAKAVLSAWWEEYRGDLPMLQQRYKEVKRTGQRNLDAAPESVMEFHAVLGERGYVRHALQGHRDCRLNRCPPRSLGFGLSHRQQPDQSGRCISWGAIRSCPGPRT